MENRGDKCDTCTENSTYRCNDLWVPVNSICKVFYG